MNIIQKSINWFDGYQRRHKPVGFPLAVLKKYGEDQAGHQAALLTYYGFLALFPLLLILTTILKVLIRNDAELRTKIIEKATNYFPLVGNDLQQNVHTLGSTGWILAIGIILTLFGARGVADVLRNGINHVWQVPHDRRSGFPHGQIKSLAILLVGAAGLILAPALSGFALSVAGHGWPIRAVALLITLAILYLMFLGLARISLPTRVSIRELRPAAIISTLGLVIVQLLATLLLKHQLQHFDNLYGVFAVVLGLLFYLYLQAQVFFYALETASVRALKLWPRALNQQDLTAQDKKALRLYAERGSYNRDAIIDVTFKN
jgi:YihY family inner membrane protein